jgi:putative ABC transport system permease protein
MKTWVELDYVSFFWSCSLVLLAVLISYWQKLKLEGLILLTSGRAILQLLILGIFLTLTLSLRQPLFLLVTLVVFLTLSAVATTNRIHRELPRLIYLVWLSLLVSSMIVIGLSLG